MFPFGARMLTRTGTKGIVVRLLTEQPPHQYLLVSVDGKSLIVFQEDLRLATADDWRLSIEELWNGVERRKVHRRQRERRHAEQNRMAQLTSDRRVADRRQAERRWVVARQKARHSV